ncbi:hypothetical protein THII_1967 [Thioploca ingrica]|uniref:Uncharacterized protein n=1 Tax=Thioploca ingrica TaxID=40754 RepID=A0A090AGF9_9GAMM|nr:hypothetical protein THII_1967 [Thioploca ingrica]
MQITERTRLYLRLQTSSFIILLVIAIGLAAWLSTRYKLQADWTYSHRHTLSETSQKLLTEFTAPITITAYASKDEQLRQPIKELIQRYQKYKADIQLNFVNPYTVPNEVREKNIEVDGELFINYQGKTERVTTPRLSEQEISSVLQRLVRSDKPIVAFLTGHGERSITGVQAPDLSDWAQELKQRGFDIQAMNWGQGSPPLEKIKVLVIASPRSKFLPEETTLIEQYLNQGGNLLWLLDSGKLLGLEPLAAQLGLTIQPGILVDPTSRLFGVNDPSIISITTTGYGHHPVTEDLAEQVTLFPQAVGLVVQPPGEKWEKTALLTTHPQVWSETGKIEGTVKYDPKTDINGPLEIAFALTRDQPQEQSKHSPMDPQQEEFGTEVTSGQPPAAIKIKPVKGTKPPLTTTDTKTNQAKQRVIIVGDGDFLSNALLGYAGQLDLGLKLLNWLAQEDNLIQIPAKTALDLKLDLSPNMAILLGLFFLFGLPGILIGTGISIWLRRRRA